MNLEVLLYSEINLLSFVVMVVIMLEAMRIHDTFTRKTLLFVTSVGCAALANLCDFCWNLGLKNYWNLTGGSMWIIDFFYFLLLGCSSYSWLHYTEVTFNRARHSVKYHLITAIPLLLLVVFLLLTRFNGCLFYFDEENVYHRGPLFYLQHILSYGYFLYATLLCFLRAMRKENFERKGELMMLSAFVVPPLICTALQIRYQEIPVLSVGIVVSFLLVFIRVMGNYISRDELTQIPRRKEILYALAAELKRLHQKDSLYFLFADIDGFKKINDEFGHDEGDRALKVMANVLRDVSEAQGGSCARYGGDEFAAYFRCEDETECEKIISELRERTAHASEKEGLKTVLSLSIGKVKCVPGAANLQPLIALADADMYAEKTAKKVGRE